MDGAGTHEGQRQVTLTHNIIIRSGRYNLNPTLELFFEFYCAILYAL